MIFHLLRSILRSKRLIRDYFTHTGLTQEIIIKWLQVGVSEYKKTLRLKFLFVSRDLVPSDRATCTITSRVNFSNTKKLSLFNFGVRNLRVSPLLPLPRRSYLVIMDGLDERHDICFSDSFSKRSQFINYRFQLGVAQISYLF